MKVKRCISKILMKGGFFGNVLSEIPVAVSNECEFFSTDGTVFIFNPENVLTMSDDEVIWAISQGIIHLALQQFDRKQNDNQSIWNQACDIAAEPYLEGIGKSMLPIKYKDPKFNGKSAEEIYSELGKYGSDTSYKSYCDVLEPGEIDTEKTSETIMGDLDSVRGEDHEFDKKEFADKKDNSGDGGDDNNGGEDDEKKTGGNGTPGEDEDAEDDEKKTGGNGTPGKDKGGDPNKDKSKQKGEDGEPSDEEGEPSDEWGEGDGGEGENKKDWDEKIEKKEPITKKDISKKIQEITERAANKGTGGVVYPQHSVSL